MECSHCGKSPTLARGLCQACYNRLKRSGSVERTYVRNTGKCSVDGCEKAAFSKNLCAHHYAKAEHPLKSTWKILRSRNPGQFPPSWERFDAFLADVGERPSQKHQLRRIDTNRPWATGNMNWLAPVGVKPQWATPEQRAVYGREWHLRKRFRITGEDYTAMLAEQNGACAVCKKQETHTYKSGKAKDLAVDHDHATGSVRGLLCFNCNQGIGRLKDDPMLLRRAALYIEHYAAEHAKTEAA